MKTKSIDIEEQLKQAILQCGMAPSALAREVGINKAMMSYFLNGHRSLTMTSANKLCQYLGMELVKTRKAKG